MPILQERDLMMPSTPPVGPQGAPMNAPGQPMVNPAIGASEPAPAKKNQLLKTLLPILLRVGLPTAASAAIGASNPFMGAGTGALLGLTRGGLGYAEGTTNQNNLEMKLKEKRDEADQNRALDKLKHSDMMGYRNQGLEDTMSRHKDNLALGYAQIDAANKRAAGARQKDDTNKFYEFINKQLQGQYLPQSPDGGVNMESPLFQDFSSIMNTTGALPEPEYKETWGGFGPTKQTAESEEAALQALKDYARNYNMYLRSRGVPPRLK